MLRRPSRQRLDFLEVASLLPLRWGLVLDRVLGGRINFFRRQEHHCPYAGASRLANGKGERGGTLVVRKVGDGEGVMLAEGEVEVLEPSPDTLGGSGNGFPSTTSALPSQTLEALQRVRRFEQEPWHQAPFCGRRLTVSPRSRFAQGVTGRCHVHSSSAIESGGHVGRESTSRDRTPAGRGDSDQRLVLDAHGLAILLPVGMLAGDAAEVVDEALNCLRHVQHLGVAVDLHPRAVPVVGEDEHRYPRVPLGVAGLRSGRIGGDDNPALEVHTTGHRRNLRAAVAAGGSEQQPMAWTGEVEELCQLDRRVGRNRSGHEADLMTVPGSGWAVGWRRRRRAGQVRGRWVSRVRQRRWSC